MRDSDFDALLILGFDRTGVRQAGRLRHRQRIHVGAQRDGGSIAVAPTTPVVNTRKLPLNRSRADGRFYFTLHSWRNKAKASCKA